MGALKRRDFKRNRLAALSRTQIFSSIINCQDRKFMPHQILTISMTLYLFAFFNFSADAFAREGQTCASVTLHTSQPITGLSFAAPAPGAKHNSSKTLLLSAHGDNGATAFTFQGEIVWHYEGRADTVSAFGNTILIYQTTDDGSELRTFKRDINGDIIFVNVQSPSEIAPTTLQRSAYASFGPIRLEKTGVATNSGFILFTEEPTAFAATGKTTHPDLKMGAVAFGLANGNIEIWSKDAAEQICQNHP